MYNLQDCQAKEKQTLIQGLDYLCVKNPDCML